MSTSDDTPYIHIATLPGVVERSEGEAVELWMNARGRVFVRAYTECGQNWTDVDACDLATALQRVEIMHDSGEPA